MKFVYDVSFELTSTDGLIFEDEIEIFDFRLKSETDAVSKNKIIGYTTIELDKDDYRLAKEVALRKIHQDLLPYLILKSRSGYRVERIHVNLRPIIREEGKVKTIEIRNCLELQVVLYSFKIISLDNFADFLQELQYLKDKIERLSEGDRKDLLRAIRFWNRGAIDHDGIDKFINFFIAFEIIGKNLVSNWKKGNKKFNLERDWANVLREECERRYGLSFRYSGKTANAIRAGILHYHTTRLSKEEAEELANAYANDFGRDIFELVVRFIEERSKS